MESEREEEDGGGLEEGNLRRRTAAQQQQRPTTTTTVPKSPVYGDGNRREIAHSIQISGQIQNEDANMFKLLATPLVGLLLFFAHFLVVVLSVPSNYVTDKMLSWTFAVDCTLWPLLIISYMISVNERLRQTSFKFVTTLQSQLTQEELNAWRPSPLEGFSIGLSLIVIFVLIAEVVLWVFLWAFPHIDIFGRLCDYSVQCNYCTTELPCPGPKLLGDVRWQMIFTMMFRIVFTFVAAAMYGRVTNLSAVHSASANDIEPIVRARLGGMQISEDE